AAHGRLRQDVLLELRLGAVEPSARRRRADRDPPGHVRRRPGHPPEPAPVHRLRRRVGAAPRRRPAALPRVLGGAQALILAEQLLLIALDEDSGRTPWEGMEVALGGALLVDLLRTGAVVAEEDGTLAARADDPGDPLLAEVRERIF